MSNSNLHELKSSSNGDSESQDELSKIELTIQQEESLELPAIIFEYTLKDNIDFDFNDFKSFLSKFGEIEDLEIKSKCIVVVFKTFLEAKVLKEYLSNPDNFRDNMYCNFSSRWFKFDKDGSILSQEHKKKLEDLSKKYNKNQSPNTNNKQIPNQNQNQNNQSSNNPQNINLNLNINPSPVSSATNMHPNINNKYKNNNNMNIINNTNINFINNNNKMNQMMPNPFMGPNIPNIQSSFMGMNNMIPQGMNVPPSFYSNSNNYLLNMMMKTNNSNTMNMNMLNNNNNSFNNSNNANNNASNINMNLNNANNSNNPNNNILINNSINKSNYSNNNNNSHKQNQLNNMNYMNSNANQNNQNSLNNINNNNINDQFIEDKVNNNNNNYGKFTCKFEFLIQNDTEFQVVRRLIGSKGCNMKKILESCKYNGSDQGNVKLRLRGKGSGYKEGPDNKESQENLHLCISAKNQEILKKACGLVGDLINRIYEDYKKHCAKYGITPLSKIANKIDGGNTFHSKGNKNNNNNNNMGNSIGNNMNNMGNIGGNNNNAGGVSGVGSNGNGNDIDGNSLNYKMGNININSPY